MKDSIWRKLYNFIKNWGWITILMIAFFGITSAIVSHYAIIGFDLNWFIFFEIPLYAFCGWAFYNIFKIIKRINKL